MKNLKVVLVSLVAIISLTNCGRKSTSDNAAPAPQGKTAPNVDERLFGFWSPKKEDVKVNGDAGADINEIKIGFKKDHFVAQARCILAGVELNVGVSAPAIIDTDRVEVLQEVSKTELHNGSKCTATVNKFKASYKISDDGKSLQLKNLDTLEPATLTRP